LGHNQALQGLRVLLDLLGQMARLDPQGLQAKEKLETPGQQGLLGLDLQGQPGIPVSRVVRLGLQGQPEILAEPGRLEIPGKVRREAQVRPDQQDRLEELGQLARAVIRVLRATLDQPVTLDPQVTQEIVGLLGELDQLVKRDLRVMRAARATLDPQAIRDLTDPRGLPETPEAPEAPDSPETRE
jgi:hypothetical protein